MTLVFCALSALLVVPGQGPQGTYAPPNAPSASWSINEHHTLLWNGAPYLPVGVRIEGSPDAVARAKAAGVRDAIVELPASGAGWKATLEALESAGMRYLIALDSLAPGAQGIAIEPQGLRVAGITAKRRIEFRIPGASSALIVLATRHDGELRHTERVPIVDGKLVVDVDPPNSLEHVLLVYPMMTGWGVVDCWEELDRHRDDLLRAFKTTPPGPGLRGILNPLGAVFRLRAERTFVPMSTMFRFEFRQYLESRYRSAETTARAWSMSSSELQTLDDLACLVPLWSGTRGVGVLYDPRTGKTYRCDFKKSAIWQDIETLLNSAMARRLSRLTAAIRQVCDVPVIQEWADWGAPYESGAAVLDGLAVRTTGSNVGALTETAGRALSSLLRWNRPGWFVASRMDLSDAQGPDALGPVLDDLASIGCRAWFALEPQGAMLQALVAESGRRAGDLSPSQWSPRGVFFPESALNPAAIMRLPGGAWWLPAPLDGNRVPFGGGFFAYRLDDPIRAAFALWTVDAPRKVKLLMTDAKAAVFQSMDGEDPDPRQVRGGVEVRVGQLPLLITGTREIPVPEPALKAANTRFEKLATLAEARHVDVTEYRFLFQDAAASLERNPGGSFSVMLAQIDRLSERLGSHTWIEAESVAETDFSEIVATPGASAGAVLNLRSGLRDADTTFFAEYNLQPRSDAELTVWLAARIPKEQRPFVRIVIGGQQLRLESEPIGVYGRGFGWFRCGATRLRGGTSKLVVRVQSADGVDLALDAIVLAPVGFTPNGLTRPDPLASPGF